MSDFAWVALIIIVYKIVIQPIMQGMVQKPRADREQKTEIKKTSASDKSPDTQKGEYVDYEDIT